MAVDQTQTEIAALVRQLSDAKIAIDTDLYSGGMRRTRQLLAAVEFHTTSPCRNIAVYMTAGGALSDVVIAEEALDRLDNNEMAQLLTATIQHADGIATEALTKLMRGEGEL